MGNTRFFLDTQQWNYLIERDGLSAEALASARGQLRSRVRAGDWIIVGSLPLLEELMGAAPKHPEKYARMRDLAFELIGKHWLLPVNERYVLEVVARGVLPERQRYIRRGKRRAILRRARSQAFSHEIAEASHTETQAFKKEQEDVRQLARARFTKEANGEAINMHRTMLSWWEQRDLAGWVQAAVNVGIDRGDIPNGRTYRVSADTTPSAWCLFNYKQARIRLNLGAQRAIGVGDYVDADIYGCSPYFDVLVTDDGAFRDTCGLLDGQSPTLTDFSGLLELLS